MSRESATTTSGKLCTDQTLARGREDLAAKLFHSIDSRFSPVFYTNTCSIPVEVHFTRNHLYSYGKDFCCDKRLSKNIVLL